jgi:hypothetical protein
MTKATPKEEPDYELTAFETLKQCRKRARRVRDWLAASAPDGGADLAALPVKVATGMRKNRMYAINAAGQRLLEIHLKTGVVTNAL